MQFVHWSHQSELSSHSNEQSPCVRDVVDDLTMRGGMVDGACLQPPSMALRVFASPQHAVLGTGQCSVMRVEMAITVARGTDCQLDRWLQPAWSLVPAAAVVASGPWI